jgi:hypothetical protein
MTAKLEYATELKLGLVARIVGAPLDVRVGQARESVLRNAFGTSPSGYLLGLESATSVPRNPIADSEPRLARALG